MSNKIALATIQFRADAKGANAALDSMRQSADDARKTVKEMQEAMDKGIKTMKDANGVEFNVSERFRQATKDVKTFDSALRELMKGATALEAVVQNIRLGNIEASSRAELKGAINAAESRKRSVRGTDPESLQMQRELNTVIEESRKQLNNLDRDTQKVIDTLNNGGAIAQAVLDKEQKGLKEILSMIPKGTEEWNKYNAQLQQIETHVASIRKQEQERTTALLSSKSFGNYSEEQIRQAITSARELLSTYKTADPAAKALADNIVRAEQYLKQYGVEAARQAAKDAAALREQEQAEKQLQVTMNKRTASLKTLSALSADALAETQKYWQAQRDGAERGTPAFEKAEAVLKRIDNLQRKRKVEQLDSVLGDPSKFGVAEVKNAVQEMERLRDSVQKGIPIWQHYNKMVEQGKTYLDNLAKTEAAERINQQMQNLTTLSTQGLQEVKKYWETMVAGAKYGSTELGTYKSMLEQVVAEEQQRANLTARAGSNILQSGNLGMYSEKEIRAAIEAGQQLIKTYQTADPKAQKLAEDIVRAERHLEQYGVAAERAAQKEADAVRKAADEREKTNQLMENQLKRDTGLTQTALKAQEQYWQRLIDDPKAAADSLARYYENLNKVRAIQKEQEASATKANGISALNRFRGDVDYENKVSANQLKEDREALKKYRDSLPQEGNLSILREIDYYLGKTGETAQKAAEQTMKLPEAMQLAGKLGTKGFAASTDQLKQAKKALEEARDAAGRGTKEFTKYQDAINKVDLELAKTGELSQQVKAVLDSPKGKSFNELKIAVEQGRAALNNMRTDTQEGKKAFDELAAKVKAADFEMKALGNSSKGTASQFDKAWSRLKTYVGLYMGAAVAIQKLVGAMGDLMELSDKMGEVRKTTGFTADEVGRLSDSLAKLDTRTPIQELLGLSAAAGQLGLKTQEDIRGFTEAANQLIVALPEMGRESATSLMKIANATGDLKRNGGDVEETLQRVGSTIIALRANSASAAPAITDFVSRVGAVGAQAGITIDQIAAMGSTIDALGGRVEMSATALSRMIPAIRNNSFAVANAIGVTESYLKSLSAMDQLVLVFRKMKESVKGIDTSTEEGMNQMADNVEALLNKNATMAEVMKELNQQGARAGIVFGLMSQNVDELERQLGTASEAYKDNIALMNEYNNMNETTAAKWARLKNRLEELFVSDNGAHWLGTIIDGLRKIIDLISMDGPMGDAIRYGLIYLALWKAKWAAAMGEGLISLGKFLFATQASTAATAADTAAKTANATAATAQATATTGATVATTAQTAATEGATVATNIFTKAWGKLNAVQKANVIGAVAAAILFLGMKLMDASRNAKKAASALNVLTDVEKKAKEESKQERIELEKLYRATQDQTNSMEERKKALKDMVGDEKYKQYYENLSTESEFATAAAGAYKELAEQILATARARALDAKAEELQGKRLDLEDERKKKEEWEDENREAYRKNKAAYESQKSYVESATRSSAGFEEAAIAQRGAAAMKPAIIDEFEGSIRERNRIDGEIEQIDKDLARLEEQVKKINPQGTTGEDDQKKKKEPSPYGDYNKVTSPYEDWDANSLVARRKEMLERVKALANGADVQAVLSEDAKFISEATRKNIKDTKQAIEWYNTERLKIQDALHEKHLTNSGDWMDPKTGKTRKPKFYESDYAVAELDRYYSRRKEALEKARQDENMTEELYNREAELLEQEHLQKRSKLRETFTSDDKKMIKEFRKWWKELEESGELDEVPWATVESEWAKATDAQIGQNNLKAQKDLTELQEIVVKHLNKIAKIIDSERPYDAITANLRDNLTKMDILFADFQKNGPTEDTAALVQAGTERLQFLLGEAETAYTSTVEDVLRRMADAGMTAWAEEIRKSPDMQNALMAQLQKAYDEVQNAIKKEASLIKKQTDIWWSDVEKGKTQSRKGEFESVLTSLGLQEDRVKRANSLIGAGQASQRVADKLAIKQMQVQLAMQATYYNKMRQIGEERIRQLQAQGKLEDAEHLRRSLNLSLAKEQAEIDKQRVAIANQLEESQNRLYTEMREWADLLTSSLQSVFEASAAGNEDYYNELAKLNLTGKGGPGAGTYIVIDNAGTSDAEAHYETLNEREALERKHQIEQENARAEAWKKVMDDFNNKMNDAITDQMNAMLQNASLDANTQALGNVQMALGQQSMDISAEMMELVNNTTVTSENTAAIQGLTEKLGGENPENGGLGGGLLGDVAGTAMEEIPDMIAAPKEENQSYLYNWNESGIAPEQGEWVNPMLQQYEQNEELTSKLLEQQSRVVKSQQKGDKEMTKSTQSAFAKMTQAANLYGVAYQAMSNDNLSAAQKFGMIAIQAAGQAAITSLTVGLTETTADTAKDQPAVLSKLWKQLGWGAVPVYALFTGLLGGLMGLAASKVGKAKSEISQITGAGASAGKLTTGMLTYAEGNVNEFTDPDSLTPGKSYNVDAADGKTYRAKYMGKNARTHITNGPEFHLVGEAGREAIIDAKTTRLMQMDDTGIWKSIQTLYNGGSIATLRRTRGRGVRPFASGNMDEFSEVDSGQLTGDSYGFGTDMVVSLQQSIDRQSELLERAMTEGIKGVFNVYGKGGLVDSYDTGKKTVNRYGQKY